MLRILFAIALLLPICGSAKGLWSAQNVEMDRNGDYLAVQMSLDFSNLDVESSRALLITPVLVNGADSLVLPSVGVYGRSRYYHYLRRDGNMLTDATEVAFKNSEKPVRYDFMQFIPYQDWMNGAQLTLMEREYGCCHKLLSEQPNQVIGNYVGNVEVAFDFKPVYVHVKGNPVKERSLSGEAYVQFEVNRTEIKPEKYNNPVELAKISGSIDSVKNDPDVTITGVWLKGFASPESPYSHNADLARGRTKALSDYVQMLYKFAPGVISTDYEPEDWAGLRKYVEGSNLTNRDAIIAIIDSDMEPDAKEAKIKKLYKEDYNLLLKYAYPPLRHTEYKIDYTVRNYTDIDEIKAVMEKSPGKLSQNEFYLLASAYEPGSEEYNKVYETCVNMYPRDENANLNAAMAALVSRDGKQADKYLLSAGNSALADYARGMSDLLQKRYDDAESHLQKAIGGGVAEAEDGMLLLELMKKYDNK